MSKKKAPAPKEGASDDRQVIVHLKGSPAYAEWIDNIHKKTHIPKAALFRLAIADWAKANGHPEPPEM